MRCDILFTSEKMNMYDESIDMGNSEDDFISSSDSESDSPIPNLTLPPEVKDLFSFITQVHLPPENDMMELKFRPFLPDYYPSVGDIDAFIKVIEPSVNDHNLGLKGLNEQAPIQSDPSVLDLRLRAVAKQRSTKAVTVKKIENVGKNSKIIDNWVQDIGELHRSKPSPSVHYSKQMPDIDDLLGQFPEPMEEELKNMELPGPDLNCDLASYSDIVCNILDIPIQTNRIESLHVLLTLYAAMKELRGSDNIGSGLIHTGDEVRHCNADGDDTVEFDGNVTTLKIKMV